MRGFFLLVELDDAVSVPSLKSLQIIKNLCSLIPLICRGGRRHDDLEPVKGLGKFCGTAVRNVPVALGVGLIP